MDADHDRSKHTYMEKGAAWCLGAPAARYNGCMEMLSPAAPASRPRFRRATEPPAFRLTDDDVHIVRQLARHRFLRSTHVAALVGRSLDRTNDRLLRLFHAGYIDRPRAQLDRFPSAGSSHFVYALADRGARLLIECDGIEFANVEWSRKNRLAGRPFIEHQLEIMDFYVGLQCAARAAPHPPRRVDRHLPRSATCRPQSIHVEGHALASGHNARDSARARFRVRTHAYRWLASLFSSRDRPRHHAGGAGGYSQTDQLRGKNAGVPDRPRRQTARASVRLEHISRADHHDRRPPRSFDDGGAAPTAGATQSRRLVVLFRNA
jgi:hypothetical protein